MRVRVVMKLLNGVVCHGSMMLTNALRSKWHSQNEKLAPALIGACHDSQQ
jgi:hypothetical protein